MRTESTNTRILRARYKNYLKRYYAELLVQEARGGVVPNLEQFLRELRALPEYRPNDSEKIAVNG